MIVKSVEETVELMRAYQYQLDTARLAELFRHNINNFNCWGTTAYILGWVDHVFWMDLTEIEELLDIYTAEVPVTEARAGDVVAQWSYGDDRIDHTNILIEDVMEGDLREAKVFQKNGWTPIKILPMGELMDYYEGDEITIHRVVA